MKSIRNILACILALCLLIQTGVLTVSAEAAPSTASIVDLRTDSSVNPIGIDNDQPCFSWKMQSNHIGASQSAYQIVVTNPAGETVWDSGKIESDLASLIPYEGDTLQPTTRYDWSVQVWDQDGKTASASAYFETTLTDGNWSEAKWIASPDYTRPNTLAYTAKDYTIDVDMQIGKETQYYKSVGLIFGWDPDNTFDNAWFNSYYTWQIRVNGDKVYLYEELIRDGSGQGSKEFDVTAAVSPQDVTDKPFHMHLEVTGGTTVKTYLNGTLVHENGYTNNNRPVGLVGFMPSRNTRSGMYDNLVVKTMDDQVIYEEHFDDPDHTIFGEKYMNIEDGVLVMDNEKLVVDSFQNSDNIAPMFRKEFSADHGSIQNARLYTAAMGIYEFYLNGQQVSTDYLKPGNLAYSKRLRYETFDVTNMIQSGDNAIAAYLGHGWFDRACGGGQWGDKLALMAKLTVTYEDGYTETIVTDDSWRYYGDGPIRRNDIWYGETYNAQKEVDGWTQPGFDDSSWVAANTSVTTSATLSARVDPPVSNTEILTPVSVTEPVDGVFVYDFGQEFSGICRITLKGEAGQVVTMRHAELLNTENLKYKDDAVGTINTINLLGALNTDQYILKGDPDGETFEPSFVFRGFRYMQITGIDEALPIEDVEGLVLTSNNEETGSYTCSNELVNKLYQNSIWSQKSNFISIPMDCPQRDERYGWTGDAQIFCRTSSYNSNVHNFYQSFETAMGDVRQDGRRYTDMAPRDFYGDSGHNGWGDAGVIIPWQMYQQYGDTQIIKDNLTPMCEWIDFLMTKSDDFVRRWNGYGDHLSLEGTDNACVNTAWTAYSANLVAKMAAAIGETAISEKYMAIFENYKAAFNRAFVAEDATTSSDYQTAYAMGLQFGLYPDDMIELATQKLVDNIQRNGNHLKTGFAGISFLNPALSDHGNTELAYTLLEQEEYPSWLYAVANGSTTIYEQLDGYMEYEDGTYRLTGSLNHYSYGAISEWLYRYSAGIERDEAAPGFKHFVLQPSIGGSFTFADASYDSVYGMIESGWTGAQSTLDSYHCVVPANTSARLYLPVEASFVEVAPSGVTYAGNEVYKGEICAVFDIAAGGYEFTMKNGIVTVNTADGYVDDNTPVKSASAPESVQVNADFTVTVVTAGFIEDVRLYNENDMVIRPKQAESAANEDGTKTWSITLSLGTVGNGRTLKVVTKGAEGFYKNSGVTVSTNIVSVPPVLSSFTLPESAVANRTFIVKATTDMSATKIAVYNESGMKMGLRSLSCKVIDGEKEWTAVMSIGTKGERSFVCKAQNKYGAESEALSGKVAVKAFAG